ncbi:ThiS family protein [Syntrophus gentianae]|uniref:ThiS family protein n=1 Tax=Syntrophus gentianae TaxID=43775 RepID=A0A1H8A0Q1_9BACT|nr:MoaD/ThiS family protein [Syntrophus gentianae]SEM63369.1 ThiS family protein [Syntrophus gentianae]
MSIKVFLVDRLSNLAKGKDMFEVKGKTLGECLNYLVNLAPSIKQALFYESGNELQDNIKVLVNKKHAEAEGLEKEITDGDVIYIAMLPQH